ncbi:MULTISPECIES: hypothetical protein [Pseudofrankia]|uniref:hypothetical protein n=1 Tax=Pseudofrankia TaxID=2994363 RepID=UPI000234C860|nr:MULTISPECIES: hypothetical protein [Pseudofrankia]OHV34458.1 hypothetical protein BCD49_23990 [Pseudofrankia sp. EUN1h]
MNQSTDVDRQSTDVDDSFVRTRAALHAVAEHVLAAARHRATGRIGLVVTPGGFGTPPFGDERRTIAVDGTDLVVSVAPSDGASGAEVSRAPLSTLAAAATLTGLPAPGGPAEVYHLSTPCDPDAPLAVDAAAASRIAYWYALGDAALRRWRAEIPGDEPTGITLWPEHADVAIRAADINYGASPGDEYIERPYLYVGPPEPPPPSPDGYWNVSFGAYITWDKIHSVADAVDFFREGRRLSRG